MAYLALALPGGGNYVTIIQRQLQTLADAQVNFSRNDITVLDPSRTVRQYDLLSSGGEMSDTIAGLIFRDWRRQSIIKLLPSKGRLLEYLRANRSLLPDGFDMRLLDKGNRRALSDFRIQDWFKPLITEQTSIKTYQKWLNSHPVVYSTTHKVIGAPVQLFASVRHYDLSPDVMTDLKILKSSDTLYAYSNARLYVSMFPSVAAGMCVLSSRESWERPETHVLSRLLQMHYDKYYRMTARYLDDPILAALIKGERSVKNFSCQPVMARAAKSVGVSVKAMTPPKGINTSVINVCDLIIECRHSMNPSERPFKLKLTALPSAVLSHLELRLDNQWHGIRDPTGMLEMWFMVLTLMCDSIVDSKGNYSALVPSADSPKSLNYVRLLSTINNRVQSLPLLQTGRVASVGLAMAKGSFKSTMVKFLTSLEVAGTHVMFDNTIVDSDDVGDALDPTFEVQLYDELKRLIPDIDTRWLDASGNLDMDFVASSMYPTFLRLVKDQLTPKAMEIYTANSSRMRSLTYAHADSEFLNACWIDRIERSYIHYYEEENILLRPNRVGGVNYQLALSRCYKMFATSAAPSSISMFLKSLFVPWIEAETTLSKYDHASSSRVLAWYIDPHYWHDNGWCTCDPHRHVTFSFIRGTPEDLAYLDLHDWGRFRATVDVEPELMDFDPALRVLKVAVHWVSQKPTVDIFDSRALFTPFQKYHISMHCTCPLGRPFTARGINMRLATISGSNRRAV
uniref:Mu A NTPase n=1 Tax=Corvid orthoreovirus TaxID=2737667 RepID=A0A6M5XPX9_9REOV|nr:mu A NTPase [Corvid orthoreovirus]